MAAGRIRVVRGARETHHGCLRAGSLWAGCALGRTGVTTRKREGDGATPAGRFHLMALLYRADRVARPITRLPAAPIRQNAGWCDDPHDRRYNRPVRLHFAASHERLWRDDHLYDLLVILNHNMHPVRAGAGSAIFLHLAGPGLAPTEGCVAVSRPAMNALLARVSGASYLEIV